MTPVLAIAILVFLVLVFSILILRSVNSMGSGRVQSNIGSRPKRLLINQFSGGSAFPTTDPSPAGTPLTQSNATGNSGDASAITVSVGAGFNAPATLTLFIWIKDKITAANSCWARYGASAADYQQAADSNYVSLTWALPQHTPFLILASESITGNVYTDAPCDSANINSLPGYQGA